MYNFTDTQAGVTETILPSEAVSINGAYIENLIDGYSTLQVSGREALAKDVAEYDMTKADGSVRKYSRFPSRTITVTFQLVADDNAAYRDAFNKLNTLLNVEDATVIFADETDKYFVGDPIFDGDIEAGRNKVTGTYKIYCYDPFKYAINETGPITVSTAYDVADADEYSTSKTYQVGDMVKHLDGTTMKLYECITANTTGTWNASRWNVVANYAFVANNEGGYKAYPRFEIDFARDSSGGTVGTDGNSGFVQLAKDSDGRKHRLQFGDPSEKVAVTASGFDIDFTGNTLGGFSQASGSLLTFTDDANASASTSGITPAYGSGSGWHGSYITRTAAAAADFELDFTQLINLTDKKQMFGFIAALLDANNSVIAGVRYTKSGKNNTNGTIEYIVDDEVKLTKTKQSFGKTGMFGYQKKSGSYIIRGGQSYIKRKDGVIAIRLANDTKDNYFYPTVDKTVAKVGFFFVKNETEANPTANYLRSARFSATTTKNSFASGDKLEVDCNDASVKLNTIDAQSLGDVGNEWADFYLDVGANTIFTAYSDFTASAPTLNMYYRKRWL